MDSRVWEVALTLLLPMPLPESLLLILDQVGLLMAHHCRSVRPWSDADIILMQTEPPRFATPPAIRGDSR